MQITLTLRGSLTDYLPPGDGRYSRPLEVAHGVTIDEVLVRLGVPMELVQLVLVNGVRVPAGQLDTTGLCAHDTLAVWPPLAGG
ncbi:MAG: MoaD/ThiS family protein [Myxococcota bacterium]|nr:MoaD/ThiS family protein [Myxococcota bacterium]